MYPWDMKIGLSELGIAKSTLIYEVSFPLQML